MHTPPFTKENRPWLGHDCIADMNQQWLTCMSKIPEDLRDGLSEWAAIKVETGVCHDDPRVREACHDWGEKVVQSQIEQLRVL